VDTRSILFELGRRGFVSGQEDMIVVIAFGLSASARETEESSAGHRIG
jgi:hypothetical protein